MLNHSPTIDTTIVVRVELHLRADLNSVYGQSILPLLSVSWLDRAHNLVCLAHTGAALADPNLSTNQIGQADWRADGSFGVIWADRVEVPPV